MRRSIVLGLLVTAASAQQFATSGMFVKPHEVTAVYGPPRAAPVVTGAPYSADEVQEFSQSLPDGTSSTKADVIGHVVRDSQGRTRTERAHKAAPFWLTEIFDPVAGVAYLLDDQNRVAHRMTLPPAPAASGPAVGPGVTSQAIGSQTIEGVVVKGTRTTRPRLVIDDWESPALGISMLTHGSNGYTNRLAHVSLAEPDPARFQPPPGFTIIDEKDPFRMTVPVP